MPVEEHENRRVAPQKRREARGDCRATERDAGDQHEIAQTISHEIEPLAEAAGLTAMARQLPVETVEDEGELYEHRPEHERRPPSGGVQGGSDELRQNREQGHLIRRHRARLDAAQQPVGDRGGKKGRDEAIVGLHRRPRVAGSG